MSRTVCKHASKQVGYEKHELSKVCSNSSSSSGKLSDFSSCEQGTVVEALDSLSC